MLKVANSVINASQIATPITFAGDVTLSTGNLVISTSGKGIDFSATPGTGTSELFADYEEGTWTPSLGGNTTYTVQTGTYVKIGRLVHVEGKLVIGTLGTGSATTVSGLPFTQFSTSSGNTGKGNAGYFQGIATALSLLILDVQNNTDTFVFVGTVVAAVTATYSPSVFASGTRVDFAITYEAN